MIFQGNSIVSESQGVQTLQRVKTEVRYNSNIVIPSAAATSLIGLIGSLTPASGTLAPFFSAVDNKFKAQAFDSTLHFKLNLVGSWAGGTTNRSIQLSFPGSTGNDIVVSRNEATTTDLVSLITFFSIDAAGNLATNGADIQIKANGSDYTATSLILIADQLVWN